MPKITFQIGEVAELVGITPKTIRHYHDIGLLAKSHRDDNNYRLYTSEHIEQLHLILRLKSTGLSLKQIKSILKSQNPDDVVRIRLYRK